MGANQSGGAGGKVARFAGGQAASDTESMNLSSKLSPHHAVNLLGVLILAVGLGVGGFLYWQSCQDDADSNAEDPMLSAYNSRGFAREAQRTTGQVGLLMDQWSESFAKLGEPRSFAILVVVTSSVVAAGCFLVAATRLRRS